MRIALVGVVGLAAGLLVMRNKDSVEAQSRVACAELSSVRWDNGNVSSSRLVAAGGYEPSWTAEAAPGETRLRALPREAYANLPAFCEVKGEVRTSRDTAVRFEVWLPETTWNRDFRADGFAFFGGTMDPATLAAALRDGYATATTDGGGDGTARANFLVNPESLIDWNHRAWHETTVKAKDLIGRYYGNLPRFSYWNLTGGATRQGLKSIALYPQDYDGIAAGGVTNYHSRFTFAQMAAWQATHESPDSYFDERALRTLNAGVHAACDLNDGVQDSLLHDPRNCRFDPQALVCSDSRRADCLTPAQVRAVQKLYAPVRHSRTGEQLYPELLPGGEWNPALLNPSPDLPAADFAANYFKYVVLRDPMLDWASRRINYDADVALADRPEVAAINAVETDLRPFLRRGGRILFYNGWNDNMSPLYPIEYYEQIVERAGGDADRAVRLFMIPGMGHTPGNGNRPYDRTAPPANGYSFDPMAILTRWRETGQPPAQFTVDHRTSGRVDRQLLVCAFPQGAAYLGQGDPMQANSYECRPRRLPAAR
ncbi:MAG: tannase/feruloyl esterase family alpha/beta hydrolase [Vicinamibacterales bacterium]